MPIFINDVLNDLKSKDLDFSQLVFILPSKRAGVFLRSELHKYINKTSFAPDIISIEDFVQYLSQLTQISGVELLFKFYEVYKVETNPAQLEPFESFSKWANIVLQDFNEIDRYLIPTNNIFDYLSAVQELNHWSFQEEQTELTKKFLDFWKNLKEYYNKLSEHLLIDDFAYQGLIYREAIEHLESYIQNTTKIHVFLGFNALNKSEEHIIQELLQNNLGLIYWNIDTSFINNPIHSAGFFTSQYKSNWRYFEQNNFNWIVDNYATKKSINIVGCPKAIGQSKYVGHLIHTLIQDSKSLNNTAIVLGDELLLTPILNSLPKTVGPINVTMGLKLSSVPLASLFDDLFRIHKLPSSRFYYKDVIKILSHQMLNYVLKSRTAIIQALHKNNITYLTKDNLLEFSEDTDTVLLNLLFSNWGESISKSIDTCLKLIYTIKEGIGDTFKPLELEYLYRFNVLFNEISNLNTKYKYISSISTLHSIYKELLSTETLDFQGEPLDGLQIMGMLESRVLDFETVIITSVNEGILPSGKTNNSFIPFDIKIENNLPTYKEKDAVYTYHFYSLIQRAKNVYLIYNTEVDALKGGEKSRFITQLEVEGIHNLNHQVVSPNIPKTKKQLTVIQKSSEVLEKLKEFSEKGFSPSSLTNYMRNPVDFYFEKILGVKNPEEVEETVAANTLGTIIHHTLEDFYKPLEGEILKIDDLNKMKSSIHKSVTQNFKIEFKKGDFTKGKNLIIFEIAKRYISNFINSEIEALKAGNEIKILAIEAEETTPITIEGLNFNVNLTGKIDRIDEFNGITRIIDYKSGKVEQNKVEVVEWDDLITDYNKYSKSFQVLCYTYMLQKQNKVQLPVEAGIISFKNLKQGFLKFGKKETATSRSKNQIITEDILHAFETQLKTLITEICNSDIDFIEKEID
ncbi:MAG: PD-(D/E)XK nuclease family protein [Winogradskyella sp.]|uniref:PD-(D/E)XK nuclease family protein n=1 Tax=Winogradskyella sp. TaxID=1883156 RepID=UPI000F3E7114|nr:PD-(D/E)XK nuclease family protein [Winogradskyella sp.]RNC88074.1 MAG: PD-(D/E)XK nuclease family protein [Winogradskyella sp.]